MTKPVEITSENVRHEVSRVCWGVHCFVHNVDELPSSGDFLICCECFHIYRTEIDLVVADRIHTAEHLESFRDPRKIYACPLCAHEF